MLNHFQKAALEEKLAQHEKRVEDCLSFVEECRRGLLSTNFAERAYYAKYPPQQYIKAAENNAKGAEITKQQIKALKL